MDGWSDTVELSSGSKPVNLGVHKVLKLVMADRAFVWQVHGPQTHSVKGLPTTGRRSGWLQCYSWWGCWAQSDHGWSAFVVHEGQIDELFVQLEIHQKHAYPSDLLVFFVACEQVMIALNSFFILAKRNLAARIIRDDFVLGLAVRPVGAALSHQGELRSVSMTCLWANDWCF